MRLQNSMVAVWSIRTAAATRKLTRRPFEIVPLIDNTYGIASFRVQQHWTNVDIAGSTFCGNTHPLYMGLAEKGGSYRDVSSDYVSFTEGAGCGSPRISAGV
jgi:hypothetical protein